MKTRKNGFIVLLLPLITLSMTGFLGITLMAIGIKDRTLLQSLCFKNTLETQKQLKKKLISLLDLNKKVISLRKKKKSIQATLIAAPMLGLAHTIPFWKTLLQFVEARQKKIRLKQHLILIESRRIKLKMFRKFSNKIKKVKAKNVKSHTLYQKPLALFKKRLDSHSYLYFLLPQFSKRQSITLSWESNPFSHLNGWLLNGLNLKINSFYKNKCTATLSRRQGVWQAHLSY